MQIEILNQYTQTWKVDDHTQTDIFRTRKTLEQLKSQLEDENYVVDGDWSYDGTVATVYSNLVDNPHQNIEIIRSVAKKLDSQYGKKDYHTLDEILKSDLAYVKGYGLVTEDERIDFKEKFEVAAQKK